MLTRRLLTIQGIAHGTTTFAKTWKREAPKENSNVSKSLSTLFTPPYAANAAGTIVSATASATFDSKPIPKMMIRMGASASFGMALKVTRYGSLTPPQICAHQGGNTGSAPDVTPMRKPTIVAAEL